MKKQLILAIAVFCLIGCSERSKKESVSTNGQLLEGKPMVNAPKPATEGEDETETEALELSECLKETLEDEKNLKGEEDLLIACESIEIPDDVEPGSKEVLDLVQAELDMLKKHKEDLDNKISEDEKLKEDLQPEADLTDKVIAKYEEVMESLSTVVEVEEVSSIEESLTNIRQDLEEKGLAFVVEDKKLTVQLFPDLDLEDEKKEELLKEIILSIEEFIAFHDELSETEDVTITAEVKHQKTLLAFVEPHLKAVLGDFSMDALDEVVVMMENLAIPVCEDEEGACVEVADEPANEE